MFRSKINIIDFYKLGLISSFPICICLLSRRGDYPNIDQQIGNLWNSLDDVTSDLILFVFGDTQNHCEERIKEFSRISAVFELPKFISVHDSIDSYEEFREKVIAKFIKDKSIKTFSFNWNWYEGHESQISDLLDFFEIKESNLPCLHITFLYPGFTYVFPLEKNGSTVYEQIQSIVEYLRSVNFKQKVIKSFEQASAINTLEKRLNSLKNQEFYHAISSLKIFLNETRLEKDIQNRITSILNNSSTTQKSAKKMQEQIRYLKQNMHSNRYKKIKPYTTSIFNAFFRDPSLHKSIQEQEKIIQKVENSLTKKQETLHLKLQNEEQEIINSLDDLINTSNDSNNYSRSMFTKLLSYLELKPNFMGLGLNLNTLLTQKRKYD
jgi:hypothetical protein